MAAPRVLVGSLPAGAGPGMGLQSLLSECIMQDLKQQAQLALSLMDLTSLNDGDTVASIEALCANARSDVTGPTPAGPSSTETSRSGRGYGRLL